MDRARRELQVPSAHASIPPPSAATVLVVDPKEKPPSVLPPFEVGIERGVLYPRGEVRLRAIDHYDLGALEALPMVAVQLDWPTRPWTWTQTNFWRLRGSYGTQKSHHPVTTANGLPSVQIQCLWLALGYGLEWRPFQWERWRIGTALEAGWAQLTQSSTSARAQLNTGSAVASAELAVRYRLLSQLWLRAAWRQLQGYNHRGWDLEQNHNTLGLQLSLRL